MEVMLVLMFFFREKQEINWMIKLLRTPVIFFSNNYLCKSIPGCAGSGTFKNVSVDIRRHILQTMVDNGLLMVGHFLSGMKSESFVKVPPNSLHQKETAIQLFSKFGAAFTLKIYEKLFETFGLITMSDGLIVPVTLEALKLLNHDDSFVSYYHCLDKEHEVVKMIEQRMKSKEIILVRTFANGPYRYEINENFKRDLTLSSNSSTNSSADDGQTNDETRIAQSCQPGNLDEKEQSPNESSLADCGSRSVPSKSSISCRFSYFLANSP